MTHGQRSDALGTKAASAGRPIADALAELRKRLRAAGSLPEGDDPGGREWRLLRAIASEWGCLFPFDEAGWLGAQGGSEHLCRHLEPQNRWEKITHENSAGWWIDLEIKRCLPATPLQYLERLNAACEVFDDDIRFVSVDIGPRPHDCRIRTTQPQIVGEAPTPELLVSWLTEQGFEQEPDLRIGAYDALTFRRANVWLFDVRPMNFVAREGLLYPIDVIVVFESP